MAAVFFDPVWLEIGGFDVSSDENPTRTQLVRDALVKLHGDGRKLLLKPINRNPACTYYLRESDLGPSQWAQYVMGIDQTAEVLSLGVSVEKGEQTAEAESSRRMNGDWSWHQLANATPAQLEQEIGKVGCAVGRPLSICVETHFEGIDDEDRKAIYYLHLNGKITTRSHACPSSFDELLDHISKVNGEKSRWADVWFAAEYGAREVGTMTPEAAAKVLFGFRDLLEWLRVKPEK